MTYPEGFLLVDKPAGWTSFDCCGFVRSLIARSCNLRSKQIKVGHSGTLDPFATGLLIVLVGKQYTRQAQFLLKQDKCYAVGAVLDKLSSTGDIDGQLTEESTKLLPPNEEEIVKAIRSAVGEGQQRPPAYSALKINGVRSYDLARANVAVEHPERPIKVNFIKDISYNYPDFSFTAEVSSGTYIRVLVEDIARSINRQAFTKSLRRLSIGKVNLDQAVSPEGLSFDQLVSHLKPELSLKG